MSTAVEFLFWFWEDLQRWLASPHRLRDSRGARVEVDTSSWGVLQTMDRKTVELLVIALVLVPTLGLFLGKAAWAVFKFWFAAYA